MKETLSRKEFKEFINKDWELFMLFLDDDISFLELVNRRNELAGEELTNHSLRTRAFTRSRVVHDNKAPFRREQKFVSAFL